MTSDPLAQINTRVGTPQKEQAREDQIKNSAGGYVFQVDDYARLQRFLMLGTDGGTYYVDEKDHTKDNAKFIIDLAKKNASDMVQQIIIISTEGRAPRQNPTLFALAAASVYGDDIGRSMAYSALPKVARTGSMLFQFISYREQMGGWSRGLRTAVGKAWYNLMPAEKLAYQMVKYRNRNNWSHRDALRMAHPTPVDAGHDALYAWAVGKDKDKDPELLLVPPLIQAFENLQRATSVDEVVALIDNNFQVSWEMIPDKFMNDPRVWESLIKTGIPQTALIRQLPRLTRIGMFGHYDNELMDAVTQQLTSTKALQKARVHPISVLIAQKTYAQGQGRGSTWTPNPRITDALDTAFYNSFKTVEPTGKRLMLAVDVSGSMAMSKIPGRNPREPMPLTPRDAAAALALVTASTEPRSRIYGFSDGTTSLNDREGGYGGNWRLTRIRESGSEPLTLLNISPKQRLDDVVRYMKRLNFGGTDLALPMMHATKNSLHVDIFVIYTDNETWYGGVHPYEALQKYRKKMGINAKLVVVSMTATPFSIADPLDTGTLDIVGFDSNVVTLINEFARE